MVKPLQVFIFLTLWAHFHGTVYAALQPHWDNTSDTDLAFRRYYQSFWWAQCALLTAPPATSDIPGQWTLELAVQMERLQLICLAFLWLVYQAFILYQNDAQMTIMQRDTIKYLRQHDVGVKTQIQVLCNIQETGQSRKVHHHFQKLMSEELPPELRRTICEELWAHRLQALDLINVLASWEQSLLRELAQIVREETHASCALVCKEGETAHAAYLILKGRLRVVTSKGYQIPEFTDGMWLGEKALIATNLHRSGSIITVTTSRLMTIPSTEFHDLIIQYGLVEDFRALCATEVSKGLCGRCGNMGSHFSDKCPLLGRRQSSYSAGHAVTEWMRRSVTQ